MHGERLLQGNGPLPVQALPRQSGRLGQRANQGLRCVLQLRQNELLQGVGPCGVGQLGQVPGVQPAQQERQAVAFSGLPGDALRGRCHQAGLHEVCERRREGGAQALGPDCIVGVCRQPAEVQFQSRDLPDIVLPIIALGGIEHVGDAGGGLVAGEALQACLLLPGLGLFGIAELEPQGVDPVAAVRVIGMLHAPTSRIKRRTAAAASSMVPSSVPALA